MISKGECRELVDTLQAEFINALTVFHKQIEIKNVTVQQKPVMRLQIVHVNTQTSFPVLLYYTVCWEVNSKYSFLNLI